MTTKIKKGYEWVEEQEDLWESAASEKMNLLDELANTHLEWFDKHSTIRYESISKQDKVL
jgi:hypothetical protein